MPKDNEVDEKVVADNAAQKVAAYRWRPIGWGVIGDWRVATPELGRIVIGDDRYEVEELVPAATVAELRAEVERLDACIDAIHENWMNYGPHREIFARADAAERRVGELRHALVEVTASLAWLAHGECRNIHDGPIMPSDKAVQFSRATLTGADPT